MDQGRTGQGLTQRGVTSIQFVLASALALILFLALANLMVVQYGRGAMRSALEQGARAAAVTGSAADCEARAGQVIDQLLGGRMSDRLEISCAVIGDRAVATGSAVFQSWTFLTPDIAISMSTETVVEWDP